VQHITWLHLSDWHQKGSDFGRTVVRDALIRDIRKRQQIAPELTNIDFVVFSGDLAFSGAATEYEAAQKQLLDPVLDAAGVGRDRLIIVPGNHDLDRDYIPDMAPELQRPIDSEDLIEKWLADRRLPKTLEPFEAYRSFIAAYTGRTAPDYASVLRFDVRGTTVGILGLNSAWMTGRNKDDKGEVNDYGFTLIGEQQIHNSLQQIADDELRIAVMHHPFDWLNIVDRNRTESRLYRACHFILCGHVHDTQVQVVQGTAGEAIFIPAGASYERRTANNPRYTNAYNWVSLDLEAGHGTVYLRRWSDKQNEWIEDTDTYRGGKFVLNNLPKELHKKSVDASITASAPVEVPSTSGFDRQRMVLEGYLEALIRNNTDLEPGGIKQTKVRVVLPLDSIYVGLQADRDRPDVDRRVMQEELDEIKKNLEREEDPKEREKQYQIWAHQARVLQKALGISGPREELSSIVQQHRQVVILGDPGSGKTTLVRYLTLCLARAVLAEPDRLFEPQELWDRRRVWSLPDLGAVRLPILLRISHYAEARQKDPDLALADYLPRYFAGLSIPHADELGALLQKLLDQGRCMVLLDGLDEIIDPTDRRKIASAIGQFANVYRETGLPDWLARFLSHTSVRSTEIEWTTDIPEDVKEEWGKRIRQRRQQDWRRRELALRMAWELLDDDRYAHIGNRFVVTSRIAGYHFAGVPGEFEHFTIRRMSLDDIKLFLEKWCPAVERRMAEAPDAIQVEQRARREIDGILKAVETTPGVRRMAENPLLLRILAIIHRNEAHLPQRRVELYETASVTLLRDWHRERGTPKGAEIDDVKATSLLGPLALYIHENRPSGFLSKGETEQILRRILASERGEKDPEQASLETREAVQDFLETVREHSGLFVERGEGLYGFMHLTFEEYFTARQLVSSASRARSQILQRLHQPRWREPILLAVGSLSKQFYDDTHGLLRALLEAASAHEAVLHRDLLFTAACVGDSVNVAPVLRQEIARKLLTLYCDRSGSGRFALLQKQVKDALLTLCNDQGDLAVENALAETLMGGAGDTAFKCALDVVDWLNARTPVVAKALANHPRLNEVPQAEALLRAVQGRLTVNGNRSGATPVGWESVRDNSELTHLLGSLWYYGSAQFLIPGLQISKEGVEAATQEILPLMFRDALEPGKRALRMLSDTPPQQRNDAFWNSMVEAMETAWRTAPNDSLIHTAAWESLRAILELPEFAEKGVVATRLKERLSVETMVSETSESRTLSLDQALVGFAQAVEKTAMELVHADRVQLLRSAGYRLIVAATASDTLIPVFLANIRLLESLRSASDEVSLRATAEQAQLEIGRALLNVLRSPASAQQYRDAAVCLAPTRQLAFPLPKEGSDTAFDRLSQEAADIIATDLASADTARSIMALRTFVAPTGHRRFPVSDAHRALLLQLLNASNAQATLASEILFGPILSAELLSWCWSVLRQPNHSLKDMVLKHLGDVQNVRGGRDTLQLVDAGLQDAILHPYAIGLVHKISWRGTDTFIQCITWLSHSNPTVRHLAAILLSGQVELLGMPRPGQGDLLEVPRSILVSTTRPPASDGDESWSNLREDTLMMRLLSGLWINGWANGLILFWTGQTPRSFLLKQRARSGLNYSTYPESNEAIKSILETANFGNGLIFLFRRLAERLAELEGPSAEDAPKTEHILALQSELLEQAQSLLKQPNTSPELLVDLISLISATDNEELLIDLCKPDNDQPLAVWLRKTVAQSRPDSELSVKDLSAMLTDESFHVRMASAVLLICADIPTLVLTTLIEAAGSSDDRVRTKSTASLMRIGTRLRSNGSTNAPQELLRAFIEADDRGDGIIRHVLFNGVINLHHKHPFLVKSWLQPNTEDNAATRLALIGLSHVNQASDDVLSLMCGMLDDRNGPIAVRRAVAMGLRDTLRVNRTLRADESILASLTAALDDPDDSIRDNAAYGLQWVAGPAAWPAALALQQVVTNSSNSQTRHIALISLGRVLYTVRGFRDVDVSREAIFRWLEKDTADELRLGAGQIAQTVRALPTLLSTEQAPDADAVLARMSQPESLGLSEAEASKLLESPRWSRLLKTAKEEWSLRRYWLEKLPFLPGAVTQIEGLLSDPEPMVRRAAAHALAWTYHGEEDRPARLRELLPDDFVVLRAMLDSAADSDAWVEESKSASHHPWAVRQIVGWLEAKSTDERAHFIDTMMDTLDEQLKLKPESVNDFAYAYRGWPPRRILTAVLAEVSERLTYRAFTNTRDLAQVVDLFARAAEDQDNPDVRRFAIRTVGNLQQLTKHVADVFFAACQDVSGVYNETRTAVTKFKVFDAGSLERLTEAIKEPSITVAYHAALLLGELGLSRSEDLGHEGRKRVADELVALLDAPLAERIVYDFTTSVNGNRVGPLYDVVYEALVRVVAGPDAPIQSADEDATGRDSVSEK
jgi:HEAT repeat protein/predicted phosphodiesterase